MTEGGAGPGPGGAGAGAGPGDTGPGGVAIRARELTRRFGDFTAVDAVSFDVPERQIFGFLGPNGAGKTTTIKMLIGLLVPTSGEAVVAGLDVAAPGNELRKRVGYMSQKFSLYPDLTVGENIELFAGLYGVVGERYAERREWVLRMADLEDRADRLTGELPLGWKQRLALGCAVLHEPAILLLDEPTSGVDPLARRRFWDLIDELATAGTTVLVSTHYMEEAEYCHRLALMNRGQLIALDTPARLRAALDHPIYEVKVAEPARAVDALTGTPGVLEAAMFGRAVHVMAETGEAGDRHRDSGGADGGKAGAGAARVRSRLVEAGLEPESVEAVSPSLEDVFVALVRREGGAREG